MDTLRIKELIEKISWETATLDLHNPGRIRFDSTAYEILKIGKPCSKLLIEALKKQEKSSSCHLILSDIWGYKKGTVSASLVYVYKECDDLAGWHYVFNGLVWDWIDDKFSIKQTEIDKIYNFWVTKEAENKAIIFDLDKVVNDLQKQDSIDYPCYKVYDNNSSFLKPELLFQLIGNKYQDIIITDLFTKLGNDSTMSFYKDVFYVLYPVDGLEFNFKVDSTLQVIFIKSDFEGKLPYDISYSDSKKRIEKIIGKPYKSGKYVDNMWCWYKDKFLDLNYDRNKKIIKFAIRKP